MWMARRLTGCYQAQVEALVGGRCLLLILALGAAVYQRGPEFAEDRS